MSALHHHSVPVLPDPHALPTPMHPLLALPQGREADVVVLTAVRCNPQGAIGFVSDPRRLNVAITRPRRGLICVGSRRTLGGGSSALVHLHAHGTRGT